MRSEFGYRFGERLRDARVAAGLSQRELGGLVGASKNAVSTWETGERAPRLETFARTCRALGVSGDELLGLE